MRKPNSIPGAVQVWILSFFCLLMFVWCGWVELTQYQQARTEVIRAARSAANAYAMRIDNRLGRKFDELRIVALSLLGPDFNPDRLSHRITDALHRFVRVHPQLVGLSIQTANGDTTWSSLGGSAELNDHPASFLKVVGHPNDMIGYAEYAAQMGGYVLPVRFGVHDAAGALRYYLGTPFRLESFLLASHAGAPWRLSVIDTRDRDVLGEVHRGKVSFPRRPAESQGISTAVPNYPLAVQVNWAHSRVVDVYMRTAPVRWFLELLSVLILVGVTTRLLSALRQRDRHSQRLHHLNNFNFLRAKVNQTIGGARDETGMLQSICDLAVQYGRATLAWIGVPGEDGQIRYLGAAGATGYLDGALISVSPEVPEGRGSVGTTWREQRALFHDSFEESPMLMPWRDRARQFRLRATATLPVYRSGTLWGVLAVYHPELKSFDDDLKALLMELAGDVSDGLARLDAYLRERALQTELTKTQAYHRALFEHNAAGMCIVDGHRRFVDANPVFCEYVGYALDELRGRSAAMLYRSKEEFRQFKPDTVTTSGGFSFARQDTRFRRKDGSYLWAQVLGVPIDLANGGKGTLWSCIDVSALHQAREEIVYQALHDALTDLPNRRALEQYMPNAIARARRTETALAVGIIDLDDFKPVNENMGHETGDRLLKEFGQRLLAELRQTDFLARLGGDEFVVVFEGLNQMYATQQLQLATERLHRAVALPYLLDAGQGVEVSMSMGIAVFPFDAADGGELLRQADAAMYQVKHHKHDRGTWWSLGVASAAQPVRETPFEPYGPEADELLGRVQEHLATVAGDFAKAFYVELAGEDTAKVILSRLSDAERQSLELRQQQHMLFLVAPDTTRTMIVERAGRLGSIHTLTGVNTGLLAKAQGLYMRLLSEHLNRILMPARERYRTMVAVETRLQDDIQAELEAHDATHGRYFGPLALPLPPVGTAWADARNTEIANLGAMPGVLCVALLRPDDQGVLAVEESAGPDGDAFGSVLQMPNTQVVVDAASPRGQGLSAQAWRSQRIMSSPAFTQDERYAFWHEPASRIGIRSSLSVPIMNDAGHSVAVVSLYGAYPNQFEAVWMQDFARSLQQRWAQIWFRCSTWALPIPRDRALELRQRLFGGGLRMFMQPIVDLRTGKMSKVEALARLELSDGQILPPGMFLPLLGDVELDTLFRMGLDQALDQLRQWDEQGVALEVSVNLSPGSLLAPECGRWVRDALQRNGIAAERLTLELLESQRVDPQVREAAIETLVGLGVKLALDDLGSGHSSLERLAALPFNVIKVDQGLLARLHSSPLHTLALVRAIVQIGNDFDREVVVEGLESASLIEVAGILGAGYGQGYALARPMPAERIPESHRIFTLALADGRIHTYAGALAYHWKFIHDGIVRYPSQADSCPLSGFLRDNGFAQDEVAQWHLRIHQGIDVMDNSQRLTAWLIERVRAEASSAPDGLSAGPSA